MKRGSRTLRLLKPEEFTDPVSDAVASLRDQYIADLLGKGYSQQRAEQLAAIKIRPDLVASFSNCARRSDLPGGQS